MDDREPLNMSSKISKEIDFWELFIKLWQNRKFILRYLAVFVSIGLFIAIFSPVEYASNITMIPQTEDATSKLGGLSGLAAMAGVNLGSMDDEAIPPTIYPTIMNSVTFQKELMATKIKFENLDKPISLYEFYSNDDYQPFNLLGLIGKYSIGLPFTIIKAIRDNDSDSISGVNDSLYLKLSKKEEEVIERLAKQIHLYINEKDGTVELTAVMPDAKASTQLVEAVRLLLQKYIINFKVKKAKENYDFIFERFCEAKQDFELKQNLLADYRDANLNIISSRSRSYGERLTSEYNLAFNVYSELAKQLEQAKIKIKDATPVLLVIKPAYIPNKKFKPNRPLILFAFTFIGLLLSSGFIVFKIVKTNYNLAQRSNY